MPLTKLKRYKIKCLNLFSIFNEFDGSCKLTAWFFCCVLNITNMFLSLIADCVIHNLFYSRNFLSSLSLSIYIHTALSLVIKNASVKKLKRFKGRTMIHISWCSKNTLESLQCFKFKMLILMTIPWILKRIKKWVSGKKKTEMEKKKGRQMYTLMILKVKSRVEIEWKERIEAKEHLINENNHRSWWCVKRSRKKVYSQQKKVIFMRSCGSWTEL